MAPKLKTYRIIIDAKVKAQNFDSAQKKCDDLEQRLKKWGAEWDHIRLEAEIK